MRVWCHLPFVITIHAVSPCRAAWISYLHWKESDTWSKLTGDRLLLNWWSRGGKGTCIPEGRKKEGARERWKNHNSLPLHGGSSFFARHAIEILKILQGTAKTPWKMHSCLQLWDLPCQARPSLTQKPPQLSMAEEVPYQSLSSGTIPVHKICRTLFANCWHVTMADAAGTLFLGYLLTHTMC